jgi:hypothetical protein
VWTLGALCASALFFMLAMAVQYARHWSFVERFYLPVYTRTGLRGLSPKAEAPYRLLAAVDRKGKQQNAIAGEVEPAIRVPGVVPMVVAVLRSIDTKPSKGGIDDLSIEKPDQRRHAGYLTIG